MPPAPGPGDDRLVAYSVGGLIVVLALATGPFVGLVPIPEGGFGAEATPGEGSASVHVRSAPDTATLSAARYGDVHYLSVPDVSASVTGVSGKPLVTTSISIPAMGLQRSSVFTLRDNGASERSFTVDRSSIDSARVDRSEYRGSLRIVLRESAGKTVVYDEPITIRVRE